MGRSYRSVLSPGDLTPALLGGSIQGDADETEGCSAQSARGASGPVRRAGSRGRGRGPHALEAFYEGAGLAGWGLLRGSGALPRLLPVFPAPQCRKGGEPAWGHAGVSVASREAVGCRLR